LETLKKVWIEDYRRNKEAALVEFGAKMRDEFEEELKKQAEMTKLELEDSRKKIDAEYATRFRNEARKLVAKHDKELETKMLDAKRKQWCWVCQNEAIYHCCWNTAYCSVECQQQHWKEHKRTCRRKKIDK